MRFQVLALFVRTYAHRRSVQGPPGLCPANEARLRGTPPYGSHLHLPNGNRLRVVAGWFFQEAFSSLLRTKGAERWPPRFHIGVVERIELSPKNLAFLAQCLDGLLLFSVGACMVGHELKCKLSISRSLIQPCFEI